MKKNLKQENNIKEDKYTLMLDNPNNIIGTEMTLCDKKKAVIDKIIKKDFPYTVVHVQYLEN